MGDYIGTTVSFGGKLNRSDIERLEAQMLEGGDHLEDAAADKRPCTVSGETNGGQAEELCQLLVELGLSYRRTCDAKYEFDGNGTYYNAATDEAVEFTCSQDGNPTITLGSLIERSAAGDTLDDIIVGLQAPYADMPPLEIVDDSQQPTA
jgi:hypothetical protein